MPNDFGPDGLRAAKRDWWRKFWPAYREHAYIGSPFVFAGVAYYAHMFSPYMPTDVTAPAWIAFWVGGVLLAFLLPAPIAYGALGPFPTKRNWPR